MPRKGDWTPDEILLTVWAHHEVLAGAPRGRVVADLAAELRRAETATDAAVKAVGTGPG